MAQQTNKTIVSLLLDETGSMDSVRDRTISGFNEYVAILKTNEFPTTLRMMTFNTEGFNVPYEWEGINSVDDLTAQSYCPRAMTNLYDAIAKLVHDTEDRVKKMSPRPEVICTIMTDGLENSSTEYTRAAIFKLITDKEKEGWVFVYLGANQDAWVAGESIGIHRRNSANYQAYAPDRAFRSTAEATNRFLQRRVKRMKVEQFFAEEDLVKIKGGKSGKS
jgi:hypothetical protein